jgi:phosphate transport system substrate-binding protein
MKRSIKVLLSIAVLYLLVAFLPSCGEESEPQDTTSGTDVVDTDGDAVLEGEINVVGSTTVQPLAERLAEGFEALNGDVRIIVGGGGSSVGVKSAGDGSADIGMASREIKSSEFEEFPDIVVYTIAMDGIAIVGNPDVPTTELTMDQVRDIFAGNITNWSEVGGTDTEIIIVSREEGSGTRGAFEELVMGEELIGEMAILQPSNGAVRTTVSTTPGAIAYLSFGYLDDTTVPISVDGVLPTEENASSGAYPVVRPLNMITKGEPDVIGTAWLDFILSEDGQAIVTDEGYLPVN